MPAQNTNNTDSAAARSGVAPSPDQTDSAVIQAVRAGNRQAFGTLVQQYQHRLFGLCLMVLKNSAEAEEVAQDAFVRAYAHLDRFDTTRAFYPWLATIAVRLAQSRVVKRTQDRDRDTAYTAEPTHQATAPETPLASMIRDEASRDIWARVSTLPEGQRTATFLFYRDDMKIADIAGALGVTTGTVKTLLHRARQNLRAHMDETAAPTTTTETTP